VAVLAIYVLWLVVTALPLRPVRAANQAITSVEVPVWLVWATVQLALTPSPVWVAAQIIR
jgi:hypothetical protein